MPREFGSGGLSTVKLNEHHRASLKVLNEGGASNGVKVSVYGKGIQQNLISLLRIGLLQYRSQDLELCGLRRLG